MDNIDELGHLTDTEPDDNMYDRVTTDNYDIYNQGGETVSPLPGTPGVDESGHLVIPTDDYYFPASMSERSIMDPDPNNTGPTTDFWTDYEVVIDAVGNIYDGNVNTGINIHGAPGASNIRFEDLTPEQITQITGKDGAPGAGGRDGRDGIDGANGKSAYELWLEDQGYDPSEHTIDEFWAYLANLTNNLVKEGSGDGSLLLNYKGARNAASGSGALATGNNTNASGDYSSSFGLGTSASRTSSMVIGQYNKADANALFTIGNGDSYTRHNALTVDYNGNLNTAGNINAEGEVTDHDGNKLSDKVDKIDGKGLSTNDFTNLYKDFLDNYNVDTVLDQISTNPVQNKAIYAALQGLPASNLVRQNITTENSDLPLAHPGVSASNTDGNIKYSNVLTFNPSTKNLLLGSSAGTFTNIFSYGEALTAVADNQIILGKYNNTDENDIFQIGNGTAVDPSNALSLDIDGNLTVAGELIDGEGSRLSQMQTKLEYDEEPTQGSDNLVQSGDLYDYLVDHGINPEGGLDLPQVDLLQETVNDLRDEVADLKARVEACEDSHLFIDETTHNKYKIGVNNGELYLQLVEEYTPPEEEQGENDGDNE